MASLILFAVLVKLREFCRQAKPPGASCYRGIREEIEVKLYTGPGPNPRVVRIFMEEKGVEIPLVEVDLIGGENREGTHVGRNPAGQLPTLELDNGRCISEITAICEYLEEATPGPSLLGESAEDRGETRMWVRRIDLNICEPLANGFRSAEGHSLFKDRIRLFPQAAADFKLHVQERLAWLEGLLGEGDFICGGRFSLADIMLFAFLEFGGAVGQPLDPSLEKLGAWYARIADRPSIAATVG